MPKGLVRPGPTDDRNWAGSWMGDSRTGGGTVKEEMDMDGGERANVAVSESSLVRVRRTERGLERQRIDRTVEIWEWD